MLFIKIKKLFIFFLKKSKNFLLKFKYFFFFFFRINMIFILFIKKKKKISTQNCTNFLLFLFKNKIPKQK